MKTDISLVLQNTQHIYELVGLCAKYDIEKAVVCPGSRCAPLLIGFGKHPDIETISVTDERSAGFIALGLAQQSDRPVVLVCTSGTAAQNFAPAVTEAFYQYVPLIVLTADRPREWIDQWDGQTIHQNDLYEPHVKGSFIYNEENIEVGEESLTLALDGAKGPVHLNIPIEEPFYPDSFEEIRFNVKAKSAQRKSNSKIEESLLVEFESILETSEKVLVLGGQMEPNSELVGLLNQMNVPIVGDVISNLHGINDVLFCGDLLFKQADKSMSPDFLITFGRSVISKNLKLFLRKHKPKIHWHIGMGLAGDPFQSLIKIIENDPVVFFKKWVELTTETGRPGEIYNSKLSKAQTETHKRFGKLLDETEFNYFSAVQKVLKQLPRNSVLHLGNSMPVRIANFIGMNDSTTDVWCNRGTSGVDGVMSTAVGHALAEPNRKHTLILGDLSFFYDRNSLWLNHEFPTNLQIVILNDGGGGIFNMISGPANQDGLTELFTTPHNRTAELTAEEFGLAYQSAESLEIIDGWFSGILEIFTNMEINTKVFKKL